MSVGNGRSNGRLDWSGRGSRSPLGARILERRVASRRRGGRGRTWRDGGSSGRGGRGLPGLGGVGAAPAAGGTGGRARFEAAVAGATIELLDRIEQTAVTIGVGVVPVAEIDAVGLGPANRMAMERAVFSLDIDVDALVIDACVLDLGCPQSGPIDGDALSTSVAAASIVAKVTRDRMMVALGQEDPRYGFELHKGYCSPFHKARLAEHGPCLHHRRCFSPVAGWDPGS